MNGEVQVEEVVPVDPDLEVERRAAEESELSAPKLRKGGLHDSPLPGEVGPCTRCGWVWTPSAPTVQSGQLPRRCSNCRSDYWQVPPRMAHARHPSDAAHRFRRDAIVNRRLRRKRARIDQLADELHLQVSERASETVIHPFAPPAIKPRRLPPSVIPPPPGMEDQE